MFGTPSSSQCQTAYLTINLNTSSLLLRGHWRLLLLLHDTDIDSLLGDGDAWVRPDQSHWQRTATVPLLSIHV